MTVLKPCPWCGGDASFEHLENARWAVGCDDAAGVDCYGFQSFTTFPTQKLAAQAWNTRIDEPTPSQTVSQDRAVEASLAGELASAAADVLGYRVGDLPDKGWLHDNDPCRAALSRLSNSLAAFKKSEVGHE